MNGEARKGFFFVNLELTTRRFMRRWSAPIQDAVDALVGGEASLAITRNFTISIN